MGNSARAKRAVFAASGASDIYICTIHVPTHLGIRADAQPVLGVEPKTYCPACRSSTSSRFRIGCKRLMHFYSYLRRSVLSTASTLRCPAPTYRNTDLATFPTMLLSLQPVEATKVAL